MPLFTWPARFLPWLLFRRLSINQASTGFATSHFTWLRQRTGFDEFAALSGGALRLLDCDIYTPVCLHMGAAVAVLPLSGSAKLVLTYRVTAFSAPDAESLLNLMAVKRQRATHIPSGNWMKSVVKHVIIIGAGPAGLAAAVCLAERKISYTVLEQGSLGLSALRQVDPDMVLLSPTNLSLMPGMDSPPGKPPFLSFRALITALEEYQDKHRIRVINRTRVLSVRHDGEAFTVCCRASDGIVRTSWMGAMLLMRAVSSVIRNFRRFRAR